MRLLVDQEVAVVSGASWGIGRTIATTLAAVARASGLTRTHVDPNRDGSKVVTAGADRIQVEFYHRVGIEDLLSPNAAR